MAAQHGVALALIVLAATPAAATVCLQTSVMVDGLRDRYGETPAFVATDDKGIVLVIFLSDQGSYTVVLQPSPEVSCSIGAGYGWQPAPPTMRRPPKPEVKS